MNKIYPNIRQFISDHKMVVLRDIKTGKALNSSFSEYGLQFTTDSSGRYIFFKNARPVVGKKYVYFEGDIDLNPDVRVEYFVPRTWENPKDSVPEEKRNRAFWRLFGEYSRNQVAEYTWTDKAYRLLYHTGEDQLS